VDQKRKRRMPQVSVDGGVESNPNEGGLKVLGGDRAPTPELQTLGKSVLDGEWGKRNKR